MEREKLYLKWDLTDLYNDMKDPNIQNDLKIIEKNTDIIEKKYKNKISSLSGKEFYDLIVFYEESLEIAQKIGTYCSLLFAEKSSDMEVAGFFQNTIEKINEISTKILFLSIEINNIDEKILDEKYDDYQKLKNYKVVIDDMRLMKPYQLTEKEENILHKTSDVKSAWVRLFDQLMTDLRFNFNGDLLTETECLNKMVDKNEEVRRVSTLEFVRVLKENSKTLHLITNTLSKAKNDRDEIRGFPSVKSSRNLSNNVDDDVIDTLISSVKSRYKDTSHRYYKLKAKMLGKEKLEYWDRNAPFDDGENTKISYNHAVDIVLAAYKDFSKELYDIAYKFFDNKWIDVNPKEGKRSGAFAHPCVPSSHPYLLLNYQGKNRDVMTLAHELGHGCHQVLASEQGLLKSSTPLTLAETASVFGEMLTFKRMINLEKNPVKKKFLLAGKIEDMLNTVVRQISFCSFEEKLHNERKKGELSIETINAIFKETSDEALGPAFNEFKGSSLMWGYIPHFIHSPFYVYAYAFGDCLVNALYGIYEKGHENFENKYLDLLKKGGSERYDVALKKFGFNLRKDDFWDNGLDVLSGFINKLEKLV